MSKIVFYYSFTGHTKEHAEEYAKANNLELVEVKSAQKIGKFKAYTAGCFKSIKGSPMPIEPKVVCPIF